MVQSINENIKGELEKIQGKKVIILQEGFIESKFYIENVKIELELDVLTLSDEKYYIKINLNQVSSVVNNENEIILFLDNDTKIIIKSS